MSDLNCKKMYEELARLKELKVEFDRVYEEGVADKDLSACAPLYKEMRELMRGDSEIRKMREDLPPALEKLDLEKQYYEQGELMYESGLFNKSIDKVTGLPVIERFGEKYVMPSWETVKRMLIKNREMLLEKCEQGFTKMLIVPFGYDLNTMGIKFKEKLEEFDKAATDDSGGILDVKGDRVVFDRFADDYPADVGFPWRDESMRYYPEEYSEDSGLSKEEAISEFGAWQICFVEDLKAVPALGTVKGGRQQIDINNSHLRFDVEVDPQIFRDILSGKEKELRNPKKYKYEKGYTAEQDLWMRLTYLLSDDHTLADYARYDVYSLFIPESYNAELELILTVQFIEDMELSRVSFLGEGMGEFEGPFVGRTLIMVQ